MSPVSAGAVLSLSSNGLSPPLHHSHHMTRPGHSKNLVREKLFFIIKKLQVCETKLFPIVIFLCLPLPFLLINPLLYTLLHASYLSFIILLTSFSGLSPPLLLQVQLAEQPAVLLENLVIHQHAVGRLTLSLPHRRRRGNLAPPPRVSAGTWSRQSHTGSLVEVIDVVPVIEALDGSVLLCLVPGACFM